MKKKVGVVSLFILILILVGIVLYTQPGFRISSISVLITLCGLACKTSSDFEKYKNIQNASNPLFKKGCYKKNGFMFFSKLKGMYYCQVYIWIQAIVFWLYGILSLVIRRCYLFEIIMLIIAWIPLLVSQAIQSYYEDILKSHLKSNKTKRKKQSCILQNREMSTQIIHKDNFILKCNSEDVFKKMGYIFWEEYEWGAELKIEILFKEQEQVLEIIQIYKGECTDNVLIYEKMEETVHNFIKEYIGSVKEHKEIYLLAIVYTGAVNAFNNRLNTIWNSCNIRYGILMGNVSDENKIYIFTQREEPSVEICKNLKRILCEILNLKKDV